jgi:hypothetical protein
MFKRPSFSILLAAVVLALPASARAAMILIDFSDAHSGGSGSNTWNVATSASWNYSLALVDSTGAATPATLKITDGMLEGGPYTSQNSWPTASLPSWLNNAVLDDALYVASDSNATGQITISGLQRGLTYVLEVVDTRGNAVNTYLGDYKLQGEFTTYSQGFDAYNDGHVAQRIMRWSGVVPASGQLVLDASVLTTSGIRYALLNAMQLTLVPEPSTFMMLASAGLVGGLLCWRRARRRKTTGRGWHDGQQA